jgi:hypothetical protein
MVLHRGHAFGDNGVKVQSAPAGVPPCGFACASTVMTP